MLSIFATTEYHSQIHAILEREDRLSELVTIYDLLERAPRSSAHCLIVDAQGLRLPIDWYNLAPPYLLPKQLPFEAENLLGLIFLQLDNWPKVQEYLADRPELLPELERFHGLKSGQQIREVDRLEAGDTPWERYRRAHNQAVLRHYGYLAEEQTFARIRQAYDTAIAHSPHPEYAAFSTKHLATLLLDAGRIEDAVAVLQGAEHEALSPDARMALRALLSQVWMQQLRVPYDPKLMTQLKDTLWEVIQYLEENDRPVEAGLHLTDAAHIANISNSFTESLGYISKAIRIFDEAELSELAGNAQLRKGTLLYTWAQNGNPQFYKPAVEAYQRALQVFRKDLTPDVFADIHHHLAVLYAEMPSEPKKRSIWAGVASASFQEALDYYTAESHPYEYGRICNNYGNALTKFPPAVHSDNYEKALFYYAEALRVRDARYPYERAISLLNFLEASWNVSNPDESFNEDRYRDMVGKAEEVLQLVEAPEMMEAARGHLQALAQLKAVAVK
ncbi:MAG: hypothetical protein AAFW73_11225 [Bacteroidota bacterium]|mgnify:CR=1 FL=1